MDPWYTDPNPTGAPIQLDRSLDPWHSEQHAPAQSMHAVLFFGVIFGQEDGFFAPVLVSISHTIVSITGPVKMPTHFLASELHK
jgi:hypothetical protein